MIDWKAIKQAQIELFWEGLHIFAYVIATILFFTILIIDDKRNQCVEEFNVDSCTMIFIPEGRPNEP